MLIRRVRAAPTQLTLKISFYDLVPTLDVPSDGLIHRLHKAGAW